ncbi:hypothetical protein [Achromobacter sp.]|uniref:hypothetical protein n=1 Tax=Achromobacter sp. TaxID=134375 RepID=UPI0028AA27AB|nr:hypothetical protein [Achromobacter sp.]
MSILTISRCGAALFFVALAAGCSSNKPTPAEKASMSNATPARASNECKSNRSKCLHEGSYDVGERAYAEDEAKRLNMAESARLRRLFGK